MSGLPNFNYYRPETLREALEILREFKKRARIIAGGTDLIPRLRKGLIEGPEVIVDINLIRELDFIKEHSDKIVIGALTRIERLISSDIITKKIPIVAEAAKSIASWQIRNRATLGGNICNASPAADSAPALLVSDALLKVVNLEGERLINIQEFFVGPGVTLLKPDEILTEVIIPISPNAKSCFMKLGRRKAFTLSIVSAACSMIIENHNIKVAKLALGAVAPTPIRVKDVEERLKGIDISNKKLIEETIKYIVNYVKPITDMRATAEYRKEMAYVLTKRAVNETIRRSVNDN